MTRRSESAAEATGWSMWQGHIDLAFAGAQQRPAGHAASPQPGDDGEGNGVGPHHLGGQRGEAVTAS